MIPLDDRDEMDDDTIHDVMESVNLREFEVVREARDFLQCTLNALTLSIAILDERGRILAYNESWKRFALENGGNPTSIGSGIEYLSICMPFFGDEGEAGRFVVEGIQDVLRQRRPAFYLEYPCDNGDEERWFTIRVTRFDWKGPMRVVVAHEEITDRKRYELMLAHLNQELQQEARHDPLTGLANRLQMEEDLEMMHGRVERYGHSFCVAFCDVDKFKPYNDHYGHAAGDEVLQAVGQTLADQSRIGDRTYRYGGEEFLVVLPEQTLDTALLTLNRMRAAVEAKGIPHEAKEPPGVVTVSAGIAEVRPGSGKSLDELLKDADDALYRAKASGRNRVEVHT
ncbi:MAG: diguanylate cyclase [Armatimonadetes bacterium]|nr:diguanylate cyclase [Armatimonadota bacterium]